MLGHDDQQVLNNNVSRRATPRPMVVWQAQLTDIRRPCHISLLNLSAAKCLPSRADIDILPLAYATVSSKVPASLLLGRRVEFISGEVRVENLREVFSG